MFKNGLLSEDAAGIHSMKMWTLICLPPCAEGISVGICYLPCKRNDFYNLTSFHIFFPQIIRVYENICGNPGRRDNPGYAVIYLTLVTVVLGYSCNVSS